MNVVATRSIILALAMAATTLACRDRQPPPAPSPAVSPVAVDGEGSGRGTSSATPSATATAVAAPGGIEARVRTITLTVGELVPFPDGLSVIVEAGCTDCDAPPQGLYRLSRGPSGEVQAEGRLLPPFGGRRESYAYGSTFASDGSELGIAVCTRGYCGDVGPPADAQVTLLRSRDGGATWTTVAVLDGSWAPYALLGDSVVLGSRSSASGALAAPRFLFVPSRAAVTPPAPGDQVWPVAVRGSELVWQTANGALVVAGGREAGLATTVFAWTAPAGGRQERRYIEVPPGDATRTTVFTRDGRFAVIPISGGRLVTALHVIRDGRSAVTLALVEARTASIHPIAGVPVFPQGLRGPVAVQQR